MPKKVVSKEKAKLRKREARLRMEAQEVIGEVQTKSFEIIRLSRVKYLENKYSFIDMRTFQRGSDSKGNDIYYPTTRGVQLREDLFTKLVDAHFVRKVEKDVK